MINLGQYCKQNIIDGHIHLFNKDGCIPFSKNAIYVAFCDIEPKYIESYNSTMKYYDDFIMNHYNDNIILLATSGTPSEMIDIHKKYSDVIKGFGEVKCYPEWNGKKLNLDKLSKYWDLAKYAKENQLPIYIHFSLYDDSFVERFKRFVLKFPEVKIVLCHCGMDETTDNDFCYHSVMKLMDECNNLWCDITWEALDYFSNNPFKLMNMDKSRLILGTDMNKLSMSQENYEKEWNKIHNLDSIINSDRNIKKLFKYESIYRLKK